MKRLPVRPAHVRALPSGVRRLPLLACLIAGIVLLTGCGCPSKDKDKKKAGGSARDVEMKSEAASKTGQQKDWAPGSPVTGESDKKMDEKGKAGPGTRPQGDTVGGSPSGGEGEKKPDKPAPPKVWHRDRARPTFARVYVGDRKSLDLVSLHVNVVIEGHRARTTVDHVFRNPHDRQLEGLFEYPLPAGASPSYYAMFLGATRDSEPARFKPPAAGKPPVLPETLAPAQLARQVDAADWGQLQEARLVPPEKAVETYEEVVRGQIDPALLEYASGNTFRGRVFPIPARGYNRVILAYEETLPVAQGQLVYRFALPGVKLNELRVAVQADAREVKSPTFLPKEARKDATTERVTFTHTWTDTRPKGEIVFAAKPADATVQSTSGRHGEKGPLYLSARLRPTLPQVAKEEPFAKHAVFLLDTSYSEHPSRFGVSMKLLKAVLEGDDEIKHFNVLTFNAGAAWLSPKGWFANSKEGREAALKALDGLVLEGATDLSAALDKLTEPGFIEKKTPLACFVLSDGHLTWGQTDVAPLLARFRSRSGNPTRFFCYRTGLGQENAELFDALTRDGGGTFQCHGEADVAAAAKAHRRQCLEVARIRVDGGAEEMLVAGRRSAVYPGGELHVVARVPKPGKTKVHVEGRFQGQKFAQSFNVEVREDGELAPRSWGEVAVESLLSLNEPWVEGLVTAYCQEFNIGSRAASFLVLESKQDYERFDIKKEKDRSLKKDLDLYLEEAWSEAAAGRSLKQAYARLLYVIDKQTKVLTGTENADLKKMLDLLTEEDCALPVAPVKGAVLTKKDANADYLAARAKDRRAPHPYIDEAQRRYNDGDVDGAVRVLSTIIEENAGRGDALRLVGYRLLDLKQPAQAAGLFNRVLRSRPFEPHSFRDLARSLEDANRHPLAALMYEAVLAGTWHNRFGEALKAVTREEYARLLRAAVKETKRPQKQRDFFAARLKGLASSEAPADLRVSITWNTDATDVDLHVVEPGGAKVYYQNTKSSAGGELSPDQTRGYGPERYHIRRAPKGEFRLYVHYYGENRNLLGGETHVSVTITRWAGTDKEKVERRTVILSRGGEMKLVEKLRY
jgi:hypothetical protein